MKIETLNLADIVPDPNQPRTEFDPEGLRSLGNDIAQNGQLSPIQVRPHPETEGKFIIVFGDRRYRAHIGNKALAEAGTIYAEVVELDDPQEIYLRQLAENGNRADLGPIERALSWQRGVETHGLDTADIAIREGVSEAVVINDLTLCKLPSHVQDAVADGSCPKSIGHLIAKQHSAARMSAAWKHARGKNGVKAMTAAIVAYDNAINQASLDSLWDIKAVKQEDGAALKKAGKALDSLLKAAMKYEKGSYTNGKAKHIVLSRANRPAVLTETANVLKRIAKQIEADHREYLAVKSQKAV